MQNMIDRFLLKPKIYFDLAGEWMWLERRWRRVVLVELLYIYLGMLSRVCVRVCVFVFVFVLGRGGGMAMDIWGIHCILN